MIQQVLSTVLIRQSALGLEVLFQKDLCPQVKAAILRSVGFIPTTSISLQIKTEMEPQVAWPKFFTTSSNKPSWPNSRPRQILRTLTALTIQIWRSLLGELTTTPKMEELSITRQM